MKRVYVLKRDDGMYVAYPGYEHSYTKDLNAAETFFTYGEAIDKKTRLDTPKSMRGNCYVTSEALFHLIGGRASGWKPMCLKWEGDTHWFLQHTSGLILDPTVSQFKTTPDYSLAKGKGFLTKKPSKRAQALMQALTWQHK